MADVNLNFKHLDQLKNVDMAKVRESADANGDGKASADEMAVSLFNTSFAEEGQTITDIDELGEEYAYFVEMFGGVQGDDADVSAEEINTLVGQINSSALKENDKIKYNDDGSAYVEVEPWSNDSSQNNCLERIVANNYDLEALGITPNSPEYNQLLEQVMDANPDIYGTKDGGWRTEVGGTGRVNAVIHDGEKINLPGLEKMKEVEVPPETTPDEQPPVGDGNEGEDLIDTDTAVEKMYAASPRSMPERYLRTFADMAENSGHPYISNGLDFVADVVHLPYALAGEVTQPVANLIEEYVPQPVKDFYNGAKEVASNAWNSEYNILNPKNWF